ncbi:hypothetical protein V8J82_07640 [Gymnodinialimonas sp. 2305UL16-5]|uniref:hypothetical protein n=1 Tax=Gymnodinialimonas mytili TaxID=3126503 RepID=UPI0030A8CE8C
MFWSLCMVFLETHFIDGNDPNAAETYDVLFEKPGLPKLDTDAISTATETHAQVAESYQRARSLEVTSFPTSVVWDDAGTQCGAITSIYDLGDFKAVFDSLM